MSGLGRFDADIVSSSKVSRRCPSAVGEEASGNDGTAKAFGTVGNALRSGFVIRKYWNKSSGGLGRGRDPLCLSYIR